MPYQLGYPGVSGGPSWIRTRELRSRPDLQSGGFNHSPKDPHKTADASHDNNWNVTSDAARPIYPNGIWRNKPTPPNILFAKGHYRFALLVGRVGIEPTHHFWYRILSPVRLPVPPSAHIWYIKYLIYTPPLFLSVMVHLVHKEGVEPSNTGF